MKTKTLLSLLAMAALVVSCGQDHNNNGTNNGGNTESPKTYSLDVTNDKNGSVKVNGTMVAAGASLSIPDVKAGTTITVEATANAGEQFSAWTSMGPLTFANRTAASTTFSMPPHSVGVRATFVAIPASDDVRDAVTDPLFKDYLTRNILSLDTNGDGTISLAEAAAIKTLDLNGLGISTLEGIQYFTGLENLNVADNKLISLDVSKNPLLKVLNVANNLLDGTLNLAYNTGLTSLLANNNFLKEVALPSGTLLQTVNLANNLLTGINIADVLGLKSIDLAGNNIASIDVNEQQNGIISTLVKGVSNLTGGLLNVVDGLLGGLLGGLGLGK